jgi:hypothetical protein
MAGAASFSFFHLGHGKVAAVSQIEDRVMANLAVVAIFLQVDVVTEYDRFGVFELELDILGFLGVDNDGDQNPDEK